MKNYEKYAEYIKNYNGGKTFCNDFIQPFILKRKDCNGVISCGHCHALCQIWFMEEYEEPEVDWSKVEVDTPILVRDNENEEWNKRYFARYEDETLYAWSDGCTSWTIHRNSVTKWKYAKLAEQEEGDE